MKKLTFKEKTKDFFKNTQTIENEENIGFELTSFEKNSLSINETDSKFNLKEILNVLRQIFIFLPATFITFYMWLGITLIGFPRSDTFFFIMILLIPPLLMFLGIGKIRNIKYLVIPLSVIVLSLSVGLIFSSTDYLKRIMMDPNYAIFLFPLALITAILTKNLVDKYEEKDKINQL